MERFEFDNRKATNSINGRTVTVRGVLEIYPDFQRQGLCSLDIRGPGGSYRGSAIIDRATARKLGAALLRWGFV